TSVTIVPGSSQGLIFSTNGPICARGVQRTINSAPATACRRSSVAWVTAPIFSHALRVAARRTNPVTVSASRRCRRARPNDPPNRPTPTNVTFFQCTDGVSGFTSPLSSATCALAGGRVLLLFARDPALEEDSV